MKFLCVIPARYASTRFPGKPLKMLGGKPIIQHVYEAAMGSVDKLMVATDNWEIYDCVKGFGGEVVMTSTNHATGTDRCREAMEKVEEGYDVVINIQGDEPFIKKRQIELLKECFANEGTDIATLIKAYDKGVSWEVLSNANSPKVVVDKKGRALMFSRSVVPYLRGVGDREEWTNEHIFYKHIGIYAYKREVLEMIGRLDQTPLERVESLEQLRWLENGLCIQTAVTNEETIGIDTPEDLVRAELIIITNKI